jgi:DNA-binding NarL/FixJ family response regulator
MHPEDQYGKRVLKAGASGYIDKTNAPEELIKAIRKVLTGHRYLSPSLAEALAFALDEGAERPLHESLSDREFEVLRRLASGKTVSQTAEVLNVSISTISTHRAQILRKLGISTTAELVRYAIQHRIVE